MDAIFSLKKDFVSVENIGQSIGGLSIPIVRIRSRNDLPVVMIMGRQHSGETHSSFIIHGLINFLVSTDA